jgi:hypothetical protein
MNKRISCAIFAVAFMTGAFGQTSLNSPYSQYGIGRLADQSQSFSRGMAGASLGIREGNVINTLNPASYSAIDSLTMLFDMGISGQATQFSEKSNGVTKRVNGKNASFDYFTASFRLLPKVGMTLGILPYSNVGYKYTVKNYIDQTNGTVTETHTGDGGLHQVLLGTGWQISKPLSLGVNVSYLWGTTNGSVTTSSTTNIQSLSRQYTAEVRSYKVDFGLQYIHQLDKNNELTLGATVGLGHKLGADPTCQVINVTNADTTRYEVKNGLSIPMTYAVGAAWKHDNRLIVDADFTMQQWGSVDFPGIDASGQYVAQSDLLRNSYQVKVGADFVPNAMDHRRFYRRVHYKLGLSYTTPYYNINGKSGPKEFGVSAGFGIPLQNSYNNRSMLNVSAQWVHLGSSDLITENIFRISVGLTFNERWFAKWKVN